MPSGGGGGVGGWPMTYFSYGGVPTTLNLTGGANKVFISGIILPNSLTFSKLTIIVNTTDGANNYDAGVYNAAGTLLANIGAQTLPNGGNQIFSVLQGSQTLLPGLYCWAFTGTSTNAILGGDRNTLTWVTNDNAAVSAGGTLPATITAPVISVNNAGFSFILST